jgi:acyl-CoA thioesterase I
MIIHRLIYFLVFIFACTFSVSLKASEKVLLILGDSLTEGYGVAQKDAFPALFENKFKADKLNWKVKAAGSSGSTSASGLERIKWLSKSKPDLVLLLLGSNDGLRGLKPEQTEKNLNEVVVWAKKNKLEIIIGQLFMPPNYGKDYTKKFENVFKHVAEINKIPKADFLLNAVAGHSDLNLADGIHPNEKGHKIVAENLYKSISKYLIK